LQAVSWDSQKDFTIFWESFISQKIKFSQKNYFSKNYEFPQTFMFGKIPMDRKSLSLPQLYYTRSGIVFPGKGQELPQ